MALFTQFTPNITYREVLASTFYLSPFGWPFLRKGSATAKLKSSIENDLQTNLSFFDSGRSALYAILKSISDDPRKEILIQSYTCLVVVNSLKKAGFKPIYVDTLPNTFQLDPEDLASKITSNTRAIIVQHTFGNPEHLSAIQKLSKDSDLLLIEDLAHSFTATYQNKKLGTFGHAAFLSFGTGKIISSSRGGATLTQDKDLAARISSFEAGLSFDTRRQILKHHFKHLLFALAKPIYFTANIGKAILYTARRFKLLPDVITQSEKKGQNEKMQIHKFPNSLASLVLSQWPRRQALRQHRLDMCHLYDQEFLKQEGVITFSHSDDSACMTYPILAQDSDNLFAYLKKRHIILDQSWSKTNIVPKDIDQSCTGYKIGSCLASEAKVPHLLNLPTHVHIRPKHIKQICSLIREFYEYKR